ncbi:MAG TPA: ABC transporter ATP-binding protein [Gemmatimonadaceae bacterium]|nr:ABC transporter ATP-binding protein [Gemmatimonadaceae bacterium]
MTLAAPVELTAMSASPSGEPALRLHDLSKRFKVRRGLIESLRNPNGATYVPAVQHVSCEVQPGEFFGLLGPNGAGKTTLFKMLATLTSPDEGWATVHGVDVMKDPRAVRRMIAPVAADERGLHWRLSALENLRLFATLYSLRGPALDERVHEVLGVVGLRGAERRVVGTYSSGMRQRLLIARALIIRPRVLLLDEPTRSLDPVSARDFRQFLREEVAGPARCTVVMATHSPEEALELCDRVAVLNKGRLLAIGPARALERQYSDERYRVRTRQADHRIWRELETRGAIERLSVTGADVDGWTAVECHVPGGADEAAQVLSSLIASGVVIAGFDRLELSLADLIERIVRSRAEESSNA